MRPRLRTLALALSATVALAGCAGPSPLSDDLVDRLAWMFAPCDYSGEVSVEAVDVIANTHSWLEVTGIVSANRDGSVHLPTLPSTVVVSATTSLPPPSSTELDLSVYFSSWPGVDWALANSARVWFSVAEPSSRQTYGYDVDGVVDFVLVVLPSGRVFFPGVCHRTFYGSLRERFGEEMDELLRATPGLLGDDLRAHLRIPPPSTPDDDGIVLLIPGEAPQDLLDSLRTATVHVTLSEALGTYVICTKITSGWNGNDCFAADRHHPRRVGDRPGPRSTRRDRHWSNDR